MEDREIVVKADEFKGNKVIVLDAEGKWPFSFGLAKAKLILSNIAHIEKFVETEGKEV